METLKSILPLLREQIGVLDREQQLALLLCLEGLVLLIIVFLRIRSRKRWEQSQQAQQVQSEQIVESREAVPPVLQQEPVPQQVEPQQVVSESAPEPVAELVLQEKPIPPAVVEQESLVEPQPLVEEEPTTTLLSGLRKTRRQLFSRLASVFGAMSGIGPEEYSVLEELLITSDLGVQTTEKLLSALKEQAQESEISFDDLKANLRRNIEQILDSDIPPEIVPQKRDGQPLIIVVVGVNGVGKTTSIGKLAFQFRVQGAKVLIGACDTFRAAAVEQLAVWAERSGVGVVTGAEGAKPSTVAYEAVHKAQEEDVDVLIIDTAGRLHTRVNLMNELENVIKIIEREQPGSPHEVVLVVDASTGQNALQQAIDFNKRAGLTGIVVTKLDGTPKGGIVVAIKNELDVPIRYVGVGESIADLKLFSAEEFTDALFADEPLEAGGDVSDQDASKAESGSGDSSSGDSSSGDSSSGDSPDDKPKQVRRRRREQLA